MPIRARCSGCQKGYAVDEKNAGRTLRCKACGGAVAVPAMVGATGAAPAAAPHAVAGAPARRPAAVAKARPAPATEPAGDGFGDMDALLALESGGTVSEEAPLPPPVPSAGRRAAAVPAVAPLPYASPAMPAGPRRVPGWKPPAARGGGGIPAGVLPKICMIGGGVLAVLFFAGLVVNAMILPAVLIMVPVGGLLMLAGAIGCLWTAARESSTCGLLYMFVPMYAPYYIITRLEETKGYILMSIAGIFCILGAVLLINNDSRRPGRADMQNPAAVATVARAMAA